MSAGQLLHPTLGIPCLCRQPLHPCSNAACRHFGSTLAPPSLSSTGSHRPYGFSGLPRPSGSALVSCRPACTCGFGWLLLPPGSAFILGPTGSASALRISGSSSGARRRGFSSVSRTIGCAWAHQLIGSIWVSIIGGCISVGRPQGVFYPPSRWLLHGSSHHRLRPGA